jgi:hypothetical protein
MLAARFVPESKLLPLVMRGLDPRIHPLCKKVLRRWMDCRVKPGNDEFNQRPDFAGPYPLASALSNERRTTADLILRSGRSPRLEG